MAAQSGNEGLCLPFSEGRIGGKAPAFGKPSGAFCQARIRGSLIDKDETRQGLVEEPLSAIDPKITRLGDLWSTLLACLEALWNGPPLSPASVRMLSCAKKKEKGTSQ